ncbi:hypothetical protein, partial [Gordonibacter pamelaeae]|uniref:hypothetical protein n=1 Tax=Gordonibacter pamelaeae TaxID=471189 RepID=UPI001D094DA9
PGERRKEILYLPVAILSRTFFRKLSKIFEMPLKRTRDLRAPKSSLQKERPTLSSSAGFV